MKIIYIRLERLYYCLSQTDIKNKETHKIRHYQEVIYPRKVINFVCRDRFSMSCSK